MRATVFHIAHSLVFFAGALGACLSAEAAVHEITSHPKTLAGILSVPAPAKLTNAVDIKSDKLEMDFQVAGLHVDRGERFAVAWGQKIPKKRGVYRRRDAAGPDELAVIDLEEQKVIVQKSLPGGVRSAVIQLPYVFLMEKSGNVMYRFNKDSLGEVKQLFVSDKTIRLIPFIEKTIGVLRGERDVAVDRVDSETMKPLGTVAHLKNYSDFRNAGRPPFPEVSPGLIIVRGEMIRWDDGSIPCLRRHHGLMHLFVDLNSGTQPKLPPVVDLKSKTFGRFLYRGQILSANGAEVGQVKKYDTFSTPHHPVVFAVRSDARYSGQKYILKSYLDTISLVDGAVLNSQLFDLSNTRTPRGLSGRAYHLFPLKEKLVFTRANEIVTIPIPKSVIESAPVPIHFPFKKLAVLDVDKPASLEFKAKGGRGKVVHRLMTIHPDLSIDKTSGKVSVNTPEIWKEFLTQYDQPFSAVSYPHPPPSPILINRGSINSFSKTMIGKKYEDAFGASLANDKLAFVIPIRVAAKDDVGQEDQISVYVLVHVPKKVIEEKDAAFAELVGRAKIAEAKQLNEAAGISNVKGSLEARVKNLERRTKLLHSALNRIVSELRRKNQ